MATRFVLTLFISFHTCAIASMPDTCDGGSCPQSDIADISGLLQSRTEVFLKDSDLLLQGDQETGDTITECKNFESKVHCDANGCEWSGDSCQEDVHSASLLEDGEVAADHEGDGKDKSDALLQDNQVSSDDETDPDYAGESNRKCQSFKTKTHCEGSGCAWKGDKCGHDETNIKCNIFKTKDHCDASGCKWSGDSCDEDSEVDSGALLEYEDDDEDSKISSDKQENAGALVQEDSVGLVQENGQDGTDILQEDSAETTRGCRRRRVHRRRRGGCRYCRRRRRRRAPPQPMPAKGPLKEEAFYNMRNLRTLPNVNSRKPSLTRSVSQPYYRNTGGNFPGYSQRDNFVVRWTGGLKIQHASHYTFWTYSDDGSKLWIDNRQIVNNDGLHGWRGRSGGRTLSAGVHAFKAEMFERGGGAGFEVKYRGKDTGNRVQRIPPSRFSAPKPPVPITKATDSLFKSIDSNTDKGISEHELQKGLEAGKIKKAGMPDKTKKALDELLDELKKSLDQLKKDIVAAGGKTQGPATNTTLLEVGEVAADHDALLQFLNQVSSDDEADPDYAGESNRKCRSFKTQAHCDASGCVWRGNSCGHDETNIKCNIFKTKDHCDTSGCKWSGDSCKEDGDVNSGALLEYEDDDEDSKNSSDEQGNPGALVQEDSVGLVQEDGQDGTDIVQEDSAETTRGCRRRRVHRRRRGGCRYCRRRRAPSQPMPKKGPLKEEAYYNMRNLRTLPNVNGRKPSLTRSVSQPYYRNTGGNFPGYSQRDNFAVRWTGGLKIQHAGHYTFWTYSDDGSKMWIDDRQIVNNDGLHGWRGRSGGRTLSAGVHTFKAEMFERGGGAGFEVKYRGKDTGNRVQRIPPSRFSAPVPPVPITKATDTLFKSIDSNTDKSISEHELQKGLQAGKIKKAGILDRINLDKIKKAVAAGDTKKALDELKKAVAAAGGKTQDPPTKTPPKKPSQPTKGPTKAPPKKPSQPTKGPTKAPTKKPSQPTKGPLTQAQMDGIVKKHNDLRTGMGASDMTMMIWDDTLAAAAQQWVSGTALLSGEDTDNMTAAKCPSGHSNNRQGAGENIAWKWASNLKLTATTDFSPSIQSWYDEIKDAGAYKSGGTFNGFGPCTGVCGHYTQVVWGAANKIGCGAAYCPAHGMGGYELVCQYGSSVAGAHGGNMGGSTLFTKGTACSKCPSGFTKCASGLCSVGV